MNWGETRIILTVSENFNVLFEKRRLLISHTTRKFFQMIKPAVKMTLHSAVHYFPTNIKIV